MKARMNLFVFCNCFFIFLFASISSAQVSPGWYLIPHEGGVGMGKQLQMILKQQESPGLYPIRRDMSLGPSYAITWVSSDRAIASVSTHGKVTGMREGIVTITAIVSKLPRGPRKVLRSRIRVGAAVDITGCKRGNDYPIVLLHGFAGWGRDEVAGSLGHYYWGGYHDLQKILTKSGTDTYTAVVGPYSSNWDRACELYAQMKGVRVDYGLAHSIKHQHSRFGKDFTGNALLSDWGKCGKNKKIHIIAHSQGGMTARMFAQLLENGYPDEINADYSGQEPISPLFTGSQETKNLVSSISTVAAVHNGTTLSNGMLKLLPTFESLLLTAVEAFGMDAATILLNIYDFKLDQFGLTPQQEGESLTDYFARVNQAAETFLNGDMKDLSFWDLSPEGCVEQNSWVHAQKNIYYFSYAGISSHASDSSSMRDGGEYYYVPDNHIFIPFMFTTYILGEYTCNVPGFTGSLVAKDGEFYHMALKDRVAIDSRWWPNDAVVNTISMKGPWLYPDGYTGVKDTIVDWDDTSVPKKGVWNYHSVLKGFDHFAIIGLEIFSWDKNNYPKDVIPSIEDWYVERAKILKKLPR